jgi:hypothetical protein
MKSRLNSLLIMALVLSVSKNIECSTLLSPQAGYPESRLADTLAERVHRNFFKINPVQIMFSEIPISFEHFYKQKSSVQYQAGFIFPFRKSPGEQLLETFGSNGTADESLYRTSPFNSYGLSLKLELREYKRFLYYAFQFMFKFTTYKNQTMEVWDGSRTLDQTESKFSTVFGIGMMLGHQIYRGNFVIEWYSGVGLRLRTISVKDIHQSYFAHQYYKDPVEKTNFYPFLNNGIRIGFKL